MSEAAGTETTIVNPSNVPDPAGKGVSQAPPPAAAKGPPAIETKDEQGNIVPNKEGPSDRAKRVAAENAAKEAEAVANAGKEKKPDPTEETEQTEETHEDDGPVEYSYDNLGVDDPAVNSVVDLLKEAKVPAVEADVIFAEAMKSGDLTKIKWDLLEAKLGKAKATLVKTGVNDYYNRVYVKNVQTKEAAFEAVGGEENWNKVSKWVKSTEKADPKQKAVFDEFRSAIDQGGRIAKMAVAELKSMYEADPKNSGLGGTKKLTTGERTVTRSSSLEPMSRAEYIAALHKAHNSGARAVDIEAIRAARREGMRMGR